MTRLSQRQARALGLETQKPEIKACGAKPPPALKESEIQRQIKDYLQWQGWFVVKIHQSLGSYRGIADLYAIRAGRHVWIEVKAPAGRQSVDQIRFQADIEAHGGEYVVARGVEDVELLEGQGGG